MTSRYLTGLTAVFLLFGLLLLPLTNDAFAQTQQNPIKFAVKGIVAESSNFHGTVIWSIIHGNTGTVILQSPVGRGLAHVSLSPSTACQASASICLLSTVTDTKNIQSFQVGDTARFAIDTSINQETISILSGKLAGFDVVVNPTNIWNTTHSAAPMGTGSTGPTGSMTMGSTGSTGNMTMGSTGPTGSMAMGSTGSTGSTGITSSTG